MPVLPFLALPLAALLRARPLVVSGIGLASVGVMALATITGPLTGVEYSVDTWFDRLGNGETVETLASWAGAGPRWVAALPFALLLGVACVAAFRRVPVFEAWRRELLPLGGVLGAWLLIVLVAPDLQPADEAHQTDEGAIAVLLVLVTIGIALQVAERSSRLALLMLAPAFVLALPRLQTRPRLSLLVAVAVLAVAAVVWRRVLQLRSEPPPAEPEATRELAFEPLETLEPLETPIAPAQ